VLLDVGSVCYYSGGMELRIYLAVRGRTSALAEKLGVSPAYLYQMATGRRPVPPTVAPEIVKHTEGQVRQWDCRPSDWHLIWPELMGAEGAPTAAEQECRNAA